MTGVMLCLAIVLTALAGCLPSRRPPAMLDGQVGYELPDGTVVIQTESIDR